MSDHDAVTEAAEALIAAGHSVEPWCDDFAFWQVDGRTLSDSDLLALAIWNGLMEPPSDRLQ